MTDTFVMKTGEATVLASHDQCTDAMPEIAIGDIGGPVGHAFANMMGQTEGHTRAAGLAQHDHAGDDDGTEMHDQIGRLRQLAWWTGAVCNCRCRCRFSYRRSDR